MVLHNHSSVIKLGDWQCARHFSSPTISYEVLDSAIRQEKAESLDWERKGKTVFFHQGQVQLKRKTLSDQKGLFKKDLTAEFSRAEGYTVHIWKLVLFLCSEQLEIFLRQQHL